MALRKGAHCHVCQPVSVPGGPFLVSKVNQTITEQYVLLARVDSPLRQVGDLPGHTVIIASDLRALLAPLWLEVLCRQNGLGPARRVFATTKFSEKPNEVVLPVFFGKTDTCITTRKSWDVMGELNPQLEQQLRVIAASPAVIPGMSCFREDLSLAFKERMLAVTQRSRTMPSFKQMMALFKCDEVCPEPVSVLEGTRQLVAAYHQLCEGTNQTSPASARSAP